MHRVSIVVPCYNEAQRLPAARFVEFAQAPHGHRIVFVNDGSRDETLTLLSKLAVQTPAVVTVLDLPSNQGKAEAVRIGMRHAISDGAEYVGFWDADLATPLDAVDQFCAVLNRRPTIDVVVGSRMRLTGRCIERSAKRRIAGVLFARVASWMLSLRLHDTQCGAKLFRVTPELIDVLTEPFGARWIFDVEIFARWRLLLAHRGSSRFRQALYELPLDEWRDVAGSKLKPTDFLKAGVELLRIWWRYQWRRDFAAARGDMASGSPLPATVTLRRDEASVVADPAHDNASRAEAA